MRQVLVRLFSLCLVTVAESSLSADSGSFSQSSSSGDLSCLPHEVLHKTRGCSKVASEPSDPAISPPFLSASPTSSSTTTAGSRGKVSDGCSQSYPHTCEGAQRETPFLKTSGKSSPRCYHSAGVDHASRRQSSLSDTPWVTSSPPVSAALLAAAAREGEPWLVVDESASSDEDVLVRRIEHFGFYSPFFADNGNGTHYVTSSQAHHEQYHRINGDGLHEALTFAANRHMMDRRQRRPPYDVQHDHEPLDVQEEPRGLNVRIWRAASTAAMAAGARLDAVGNLNRMRALAERRAHVRQTRKALLFAAFAICSAGKSIVDVWHSAQHICTDHERRPGVAEGGLRGLRTGVSRGICDIVGGENENPLQEEHCGTSKCRSRWRVGEAGTGVAQQRTPSQIAEPGTGKLKQETYEGIPIEFFLRVEHERTQDDSSESNDDRVLQREERAAAHRKAGGQYRHRYLLSSGKSRSVAIGNILPLVLRQKILQDYRTNWEWLLCGESALADKKDAKRRRREDPHDHDFLDEQSRLHEYRNLLHKVVGRRAAQGYIHTLERAGAVVLEFCANKGMEADPVVVMDRQVSLMKRMLDEKLCASSGRAEMKEVHGRTKIALRDLEVLVAAQCAALTDDRQLFVEALVGTGALEENQTSTTATATRSEPKNEDTKPFLSRKSALRNECRAIVSKQAEIQKKIREEETVEKVFDRSKEKSIFVQAPLFSAETLWTLIRAAFFEIAPGMDECSGYSRASTKGTCSRSNFLSSDSDTPDGEETARVGADQNYLWKARKLWPPYSPCGGAAEDDDSNGLLYSAGTLRRRSVLSGDTRQRLLLWFRFASGSPHSDEVSDVEVRPCFGDECGSSVGIPVTGDIEDSNLFELEGGAPPDANTDERNNAESSRQTQKENLLLLFYLRECAAPVAVRLAPPI
ncbi:unnamed protein product [Amoebophrya sp. A25]|nr:unnamed protein product [Amoebophrya sp. A25]|eukprot:GSA25T00023658001.1